MTGEYLADPALQLEALVASLAVFDPLAAPTDDLLLRWRWLLSAVASLADSSGSLPRNHHSETCLALAVLAADTAAAVRHGCIGQRLRAVCDALHSARGDRSAPCPRQIVELLGGLFDQAAGRWPDRAVFKLERSLLHRCVSVNDVAVSAGQAAAATAEALGWEHAS
jgi:hypothetical protein